MDLKITLKTDKKDQLTKEQIKFGLDLKFFFAKSVDRGEKEYFKPEALDFLSKYNVTPLSVFDFLSKNQEDVIYQCIFGLFHERGIGTEANANEAFSLYKTCAEKKNNSTAQALLSLCFLEGIGTAKDPYHGYLWAKKSAEGKSSAGMSQLAFCFFQGAGVQKNLQMAVYWAEKSAKAGSAVGQLALGRLSEGESQNDKAFFWYTQSAGNLNTNGMYHLGRAYQYGIGTPKHLKLAFQWLSKAAYLGHHHSQQMLGHFYLNGQGVLRDFHNGLFWLGMAKRSGCQCVQSDVAELFSVSNE
ncbi:hypothetical protein G9A89_008919 [Geosiphon pyriformis]|nr:hypothetical protein G9A89_008919 [Geosiphon pyriformis]